MSWKPERGKKKKGNSNTVIILVYFPLDFCFANIATQVTIPQCIVLPPKWNICIFNSQFNLKCIYKYKLKYFISILNCWIFWFVHFRIKLFYVSLENLRILQKNKQKRNPSPLWMEHQMGEEALVSVPGSVTYQLVSLSIQRCCW